jgi:hypothetical protein
MNYIQSHWICKGNGPKLCLSKQSLSEIIKTVNHIDRETNISFHVSLNDLSGLLEFRVFFIFLKNILSSVLVHLITTIVL